MKTLILLLLSLTSTSALATSGGAPAVGTCGQIVQYGAIQISVHTLLKTNGPRHFWVSPNGQFFLSGRQDQPTELVDLKTREKVRVLDTRGWDWSTGEFSPDSAMFAFGDYEHVSDKTHVVKLQVQGAQAPRKNLTVAGDSDVYIHAVRWSADSEFLCRERRKEMDILRVDTGEVIQKLEDVRSYVWHPEKPILYYTTAKNKLFSFNSLTGETVALTENAVVAALTQLLPGRRRLVEHRANPLLEHLGSAPQGGPRDLVVAKDSQRALSVIGSRGELVAGEQVAFDRDRTMERYPSYIKLHAPSPNGRFLVSTQMTGKSWYVRRKTTAAEAQEREDEGFVPNNMTTTGKVEEFQVTVRDLETGAVHSFLDNHLMPPNGGTILDRFKLAWIGENSFVLGREGGEYASMKWSLGEDGKQQIVRQSEVSFGTGTREGGRPTLVLTNDNQMLMMSLRNGVLSFRAADPSNQFSALEIPLKKLKDDGRIAFSEYAVVQFLGFSGDRHVILEIVEAGVGGSTSTVISVELLLPEGR